MTTAIAGAEQDGASPFVVVLLGMPGAGKGTQSQPLVSRYALKHLSTGDILRSEIARKSDLGQKMRSIVNSGKLVPDELVTALVGSRIEAGGKYLLDGFPRNIEQAKALALILAKVHSDVIAIYLDASREEVVKRLTARRICGACGEVFNLESRKPRQEGKCDNCEGTLSQRPDDFEGTVKMRLRVFDEITRPVLAFYKEADILHTVPAVGDAAGISSELFRIIDESIE